MQSIGNSTKKTNIKKGGPLLAPHQLGSQTPVYLQSSETCTERNEGVAISVPSPCSQSASSTPLSDFSRQISLPLLLNRRMKFSPCHPHAQRLNASLAKLLALQLLPFQLVDSAAFHEFVECAVPQWQVPKCHFFSRKTIPVSLPARGRQCLGLVGQGGQQ